MAGSVVVHKWNMKRRTKCDENKPFCRKCVSTGRTCDGYESPFRAFASQPINNAYADGKKSDPGLQSAYIEVTSRDIDLLSRHFSIKTMFDVNLDCDEEARQVLQASLTDPPIRHALLSLRTLRRDVERLGDGQQTSSYHYGLQQYTKALGGLASTLSSPSSNGLKSALLCCQIFISIEQVRKNFAGMAQHIIQGLNIMHEYRARPSFVTPNKLMPGNHDQLPLLDVFIIKMFAAPCKFTTPPTAVEAPRTLPHQQPAESHDLRTIAPDMRTELTRISALTLEFLDRVSQIKTEEIALQLLSEKAALLDSLEKWLINLELVQTKTRPSGPEPVSVSFQRLFHLVLKIVLLGALDFSQDVYAELQPENDRLQAIANNVGERVSTYRYKVE
ncbi:hypothetical protein UA08_01030 [Talaromyces atroroseus]|uniref:Zn(2)-C6 fungal-type domain-containing protein n=1 Tax=Talaromyces atroroseus TaxID=1441469 RepID=A0A225B1W0_TALAT|nr:hypothetical protein UA08_01030 [Talaromyces atroroseus]OKL63688.1 hypothetical protein UA08_01030 [Talaromyces atroroseus]